MKKSGLTEKQKEELEQFGANTWFVVESPFKQYLENPTSVPDQWKNFFSSVTGETKSNGTKKASNSPSLNNFEMPHTGSR